MKNKKMKLALVLMLAVGLTACGGDEKAETASGVAANASSETSQQATSGAGDMKKIGILQYAPHPSLDNCTTGLIAGLKEGGFEEGKNLEIDFQNAQGETTNADLIAKNMSAKNYDLLAAVATPAAMSSYAATKDKQTPIVFTAVSDPVEAQLVKTLEKPGTSATGSSDVLPLEAQVKLIRAFLPEAKKIGILYTTSEPNSVSMLEKFRGIAEAHGFEVVEQGITNSSEVASGAAALVAKGVDCFNNFTDNNVVNNLPSELQAAKKAGIPVFGSEVEQVKNGCLASVSIDYVALGKETGLMAAKILKGEKTPADMPVYEVKDAVPVYNEKVLQELGLQLPAEYEKAQKVGE